MITVKKIASLKKRVQLRKIADVFHEAKSENLDSEYLRECLDLLPQTELLPQSDIEKIESFFANADDETITGLKTFDNIIREIDEDTKQALLEWMESTRRMHIVSMIDNLPEERKEEIFKEEEKNELRKKHDENRESD